ncbi:MAG: IS1595 family transposase [Lachnospiraceae bacterium]|nr:IS1595 family transposase [Lachnospiraceae bacterium]
MGLSKNEYDLLKQLVNNLDDNQKLDIANLLNTKKQKTKITKNEISKIYKSITTTKECPHCHSKHIIKCGKSSNKQKYYCKECNTYFIPTENTLLFNTKKDISVWATYMNCMLDKKSIRECAKICNISLKTSFNWRHKILDVLSNMMNDVKLNGIVESDETYTAISYKGNHKKSKTFIMPREPHKRGGDIHIRGLSKEQVCIFCSLNLNNLSYGKVSNLGKPNWKSIYNIIKDNIEKGSIFVTDDFSGYDKISDKLNLDHIAIKRGKHTNGTFNIQKMNNYHSQLKLFINGIFKGVSTKYLNNYIVYHNFVNISKSDKNKKTLDLQEYIFKTNCKDLIKGNMRPAIPA